MTMMYGPQPIPLLPKLRPLMGGLQPLVRNVEAMNARGIPESGPTGLAAFLSKPGLAQALMSFGGAMLSESDRPGGSVGGALGRALPMGMEAYAQGQQNAAIDAAMEGAPPEMQKLLRALPREAQVPALLSMMKKPAPVAVGANERLVDPTTGDAIVDVVPETPEPVDPLKGLSSDMRDALFALGVDPANMTEDQRQAALALSERLKRSGATSVSVGTNDVSKLPTGVQAGIVGSQGVRDALDRFEGYAESWLALPASARAMGQLGVPNQERDVLLGNMESVRQELVLSLKNLAELGVLAGPDMDILNKMIGDPTDRAAMFRSPDYTLTRIKRVREYVDNKIRAYEQTYGIKVPGENTAPKSGPSLYERYPNLRPPGG